MTSSNIGILSPGDMGQAVAQRLQARGHAVFTALDDRSPRTRALAARAGIEDCGSVAQLVARCDMVWSILNPAAAVDKAREVAAALTRTDRRILYVDCNAIAPETAREIETLITDCGSRFVDAGIIGPPPRGNASARLYVSGTAAAELAGIVDDQLLVRILSERAGDASALKMCYAAITKGAVALGTELFIAARKLGVADALEQEFALSMSVVHDWLLTRTPSMPPKAYRWVPEMREIAKTFADAGLTPRLMEGAADMYEAIAATELGRESPERARERAREPHEVIRALASEL